MSKKEILCDFCKKVIWRYPSQIKTPYNFCSRLCKNKHVSKKYNPNGYRRNFNAHHLSELNRKMNPTRMTPEVRRKIRLSKLGTGAGRSYEKYYGEHTHRVVAAKMLKRKLKSGEVVHHIDGNKRNNDPSNLMVFKSQEEHIKWHIKHDERYKQGGGA